MIVEVVVCGCAVICTLFFILWLRHNSSQPEQEKQQPKQDDKQNEKKWEMV
jgi:hypothetical protein